MRKRKYNYDLAEPLPGERPESNSAIFSRWERKQGIQMCDLSREEWLDVVATLLSMTQWEAEEYLNHLEAIRDSQL